jgi:hypothetical protein
MSLVGNWIPRELNTICDDLSKGVHGVRKRPMRSWDETSSTAEQLLGGDKRGYL